MRNCFHLLFSIDSIDLRIAFDLLDRNQDGKITANELQFMLKNLGIDVRDELIDDLIKEASHSGAYCNLNLIENDRTCSNLDVPNHLCVSHHPGNGLMDEEFREWVQKIQSLQEESISSSSTSQTDTDDDITQDLIAAFR